MSKRKVMLLLVAGVIALITVAFARSMMKQEPAPVAETTVPTTEVLVAVHDMPTGSILKESDVKWSPWPSQNDTTKLYVKGKVEIASLAGAVLRDGVHINDPLSIDHVVQPHEQGFLAAVLTPGMRAISLTLTPSAEVAGFIFPGDHVDVILTHSFSRKDVTDLTERRVGETVLTNVRVLALDQRYDNQTNDPKVATLATLEVTPKQAEKLALAVDMAGSTGNTHGSLSLVLRSLAVEGETPPPQGHNPTWDSDISSAFPTINGEDGLMHKVQIMRGKDTTETNFEQHK